MRNRENWSGFDSAGQDITQRKQIEEQLSELNERLEERITSRTVQLEAINRELESFSYMVSHDLRAPLRSIDSFSRIVAKEYSQDLPPEGRKYLNLVTENVTQMRKLIERSDQFLPREPEIIKNRDGVPPGSHSASLLNTLRKSRKTEISRSSREIFRRLSGDPAMMKQVFSNLLSNALKFTRHRDHARIEIGSFPKDKEIVYYVRDNGTGFDMRYSQKLFGVFQRLHSSEDYEGTGLGLAIVQRIIHRHGGSIWAEGETRVRGRHFISRCGEVSDDV